jgi:myosin tail region-interacting protein MTI1
MALQVRAKYDYSSAHEDDLIFSAGQLITVTEEIDEEWYSGEYVDGTGKVCEGIFPRSFVTVVKAGKKPDPELRRTDDEVEPLDVPSEPHGLSHGLRETHTAESATALPQVQKSQELTYRQATPSVMTPHERELTRLAVPPISFRAQSQY